jgi:glutamine---fructose-6-phosphate transaminase (isomerizing)
MGKQPGQYTFTEIMSQPAAWRDTLQYAEAQRERVHTLYTDRQYSAVFFTGCGSTYYLALAAAALFRLLGSIPAFGVPASELWLDTDSMYKVTGRALLVALSRSGETTETLQACAEFRRRGVGDVLTLCCYPDSTLARSGELNIVVEAGQEDSFAQTRAFSSLYAALSVFISTWTGHTENLRVLNTLPDHADAIIAESQRLAKSVASEPLRDRFYFLGSGLRYGLACELSMKMKEMSLSHCEPFHVLEFRHGPRSMITPDTQIIALLSTDKTAHAHEVEVIKDMKQQGAHVLTIGHDSADLQIPGALSQEVSGALYLPVGQLIAYEYALLRGHDPDRPANLAPVVKLDVH